MHFWSGFFVICLKNLLELTVGGPNYFMILEAFYGFHVVVGPDLYLLFVLILHFIHRFIRREYKDAIFIEIFIAVLDFDLAILFYNLLTILLVVETV